jgi:hypothetical protein
MLEYEILPCASLKVILEVLQSSDFHASLGLLSFGSHVRK